MEPPSQHQGHPHRAADSSMPRVWIDQTENLRVSSGPLVGAAIDLPPAGYCGEAYSFPFEGWVVGRSSPVVAVQLVPEDKRDGVFVETKPGVSRPDVAVHLADHDAASAGFSTFVSTLGLPSSFELFAWAKLADRTHHRFAVLRGRVTKPALDFSRQTSPLLVATTGRTGSTWLMRLLGLHPELLTFRPFEYEPRLVSYWSSVISGLGNPRSYLQPLATRFASRRWWLGDEAEPGEPVAPPAWLDDLLGRQGIERLAELACERIDSFYQAVASVDEEPGFSFFAEKVAPDRRLMEVVRWLYPSSKRIYLVRDPRDLVLSVLAYGRRKNTLGFGRERVDSDEEFVKETGSVLAHLHRLHQADPSSVLVRYEDLILSEEAELLRLFAALDVESSEPLVQRIGAQARQELPGMVEHRTAQDIESSIGRWRRELSPEAQDSWTEALEPVLTSLGYEMSQQPSATKRDRGDVDDASALRAS